MASTPISFPDKDATLHLVQQTASEIQGELEKNSIEWAGSLNQEAYFRREAFLSDQRLTKDGGLTPWALVSGSGPSRQVLASCETIRKKALVGRRDANGKGRVQEVVCHGVCSVFCAPAYRGRGYAGKMIALLGEALQSWQAEQTECLFSVLYSDIGKKFYTAHAWHPYPSSHVALPPVSGDSAPTSSVALPETRPLYAADLATLCELDEKLVRARLAKAAQDQDANKRWETVAVIPDAVTAEWHLAREAFVSHELYGKSPDIVGAMVGTEVGRRVWCYWVRHWYNRDSADAKGNTMHILRLVVEDAEWAERGAAAVDGEEQSAAQAEAEAKAGQSYVAEATAALLQAARLEAGKWTMGEVDLWNPTAATLAAARILVPGTKVVQRETDSIASLRWYGGREGTPLESVEWIGNEKYSWC